MLKRKDPIQLELCKFAYKYKNDLLPVSVKNLLMCVVVIYIVIIPETEMYQLSTSIIVIYSIKVFYVKVM